MGVHGILSQSVLLGLFFVVTCFAEEQTKSGVMERRGWQSPYPSVSESAFLVPTDAKSIPIPGGDFEGGKAPAGWRIEGDNAVAADAPEGSAYGRLLGRNDSTPRMSECASVPGIPHFVSFWVKSRSECQLSIWTGSAETKLQTVSLHFLPIPATGNKWRNIGYYFWMANHGNGKVSFQLSKKREHDAPAPEEEVVCIDDFKFRTASEAEMSAAYEADRLLLPPWNVASRPSDGRNLALSVAKWKGQAGLPGKPFVIWALGSSFTNGQGDGYPLIRAIRERFPNAPPIVYKKHASGGQPWDYVFGWVRQFVAADQPDLIFTYTNGSLEGLDSLLTEIRRRTTADVIVPSIHHVLKIPDTVEVVEGVAIEGIREICRKHGAEFVDNRRELVEYLKQAGLEPKDLLADAVHQNQHGRIRIWDNICRHVSDPNEFNYAPESRERRIAVCPATSTPTEQVAATGAWAASNGILRSSEKDARLKVRFTGNRIDLIGRKKPGGGTLRVLIDGVPGEHIPAFYTTIIQCSYSLWGIAPHAVDLMANVVPQTWTITMTSDTGDYRLTGSVTGFDGEGNVMQSFVSRSGQIGIDPRHWRNRRFAKKGSPVVFEYGNKKGDVFTFDVYRSVAGTVSLRPEQPELVCEPLAQNLPNGLHTLELVGAGDGEVAIEGLYVFQPPETTKPVADDKPSGTQTK